MDSCYRDHLNTCNVTRIYPSGCCPFDNDCGCGCARKGGCGCGCGAQNRSTCCCHRGDDGVNRINFCPCGTNTCCGAQFAGAEPSCGCGCDRGCARSDKCCD
ncbi:MAG: hypothetical protein ACI4IV_04445 [Acutalibacteraceae bacterium]